MNSVIENLIKKNSDLMVTRRKARRFTVQVLFCNEFLNENISSVIERISDMLDFDIDDFTHELIIKTYESKLELDKYILNCLKNHDLERLSVLDKVLIRLAVSEFLYFPEIPGEVTINEALELSKEFISNRRGRFINGILDALFKKLLESNLINKNESSHSS